MMRLISVVKKKKNNWHKIGYSADEGPLVLPCLYHNIDDKNNKAGPEYIQRLFKR